MPVIKPLYNPLRILKRKSKRPCINKTIICDLNNTNHKNKCVRYVSKSVLRLSSSVVTFFTNRA